MSFQTLSFVESYDKDRWDDIGSALNNISSALNNPWENKEMYLQHGDKPVLTPFRDSDNSNYVYGGFTWKVTRENEKRKTWKVYDCRGIHICDLKGAKKAWSWVKQHVQEDGCVRVLNRRLWVRGPEGSDVSVVAYSKVFVEEVVERMTYGSGVCPNMRWYLRSV
jgi:hypothetical protein